MSNVLRVTFPTYLSSFLVVSSGRVTAPCYSILARSGYHPALGSTLNLKKKNLKKNKNTNSPCPPTPGLKFQRQPHSTLVTRSPGVPLDFVPLTAPLFREASSYHSLKQHPCLALSHHSAVFFTALFVFQLYHICLYVYD